MKLKSSILLLIMVVAIFISCDKDTPENNTPEQKENSPPEKPQVDIVKVSHNSATINCNNVYDPDQDLLYYSLFLEDSLILENSTAGFLYKFENLEPNATYAGVVQVSDSINEAVEMDFSFYTTRYVTRFSNTYTSFLGNVGGGISIELDDDGGYIILGTYSTSTHYLYTMKIDSLGYEIWSMFYDIHVSNFHGDIIKVSTGNYVFVIQENVIMIDAEGEIIWHYTKEGNADYKSIIENENQELLIAGETSLKASLSKFNLDGEEIWEHHYHGMNERFLNSICTTHDENYMIFGSERAENDNDFWIIKIDQNGEMLWEKVYEDPDYAFAEQIILCKDNGFVMVGQSWGSMNISTSRILKTDVGGNLLWDKGYRWDSFKTDVRSIVQNEDESFIFCADNGYSPSEAVLVKLNPAGDLIWKHHFKPEEAMDYIWSPHDMKLCPDKGVIVAGYKGWVWNGWGDQEKGLWVFKTDEDGYFSPE